MLLVTCHLFYCFRSFRSNHMFMEKLSGILVSISLPQANLPALKVFQSKYSSMQSLPQTPRKFNIGTSTSKSQAFFQANRPTILPIPNRVQYISLLTLECQINGGRRPYKFLQILKIQIEIK